MLYVIHCASCTVRYTEYRVHCMSYDLQCTVHIVQDFVYKIDEFAHAIKSMNIQRGGLSIDIYH